MTILSNKNTPRVSYTASGSQTVFAIPFEFFNVADVKVYNGTTLLTYNASPSTTSQYSITGTASSSDDAYEFGAGGSITLGSTGASANDIITIIRDISIERTSDFPAVGSFNITALNTQLDQIIAEIADRKQQSDRSIKLADSDSVVADLTLPAKATRASKVLAFDADGDPETEVTSTGLSTLATVADEIGRLGTVDAVADLAILGTAAVVTDLDLLGTSAVVTDMDLLGTSGNVTNMATLGASGVVANIATVAGQITPTNNIATVAGISSDITAVAGIASDIADVQDKLAEIETAADDLNEATSEIDTVAGAITNIDLVGNAIANVNLVGGQISPTNNIATVATNIADINNFVDQYKIAATAPSGPSEGDLWCDTTANILKVHNGTSFVAVTSATAGITDVVDDGSPSLGGDLDLNGNNIDFPTTTGISDVLDEDAMGSNSATKLATQQSIKAYVDNASGKTELYGFKKTNGSGNQLEDLIMTYTNGNDTISVSNADATQTDLYDESIIANQGLAFAVVNGQLQVTV